MASLLIPDISEWQSDPNFVAIKRQNGGAIILRVAYGDAHPDKKFAGWRTRVHQQGFRAVGLYHYIVAGQNITSQAQEFVRLVGSLRAGEWVIADIEEGGGNQAGRARTWISYVTKHLGGTAWIYSGEAFSAAHGLHGVAPLWIAAYRSSEPTAKHVLWQSTNGTVGAHAGTSWPGIGHCDTSIYHGSLADLVNLIGGDDVSAEEVWDRRPSSKDDRGNTWQMGTYLINANVLAHENAADLAKLQASVAALAKKSGVQIDEQAVAGAIIKAMSVDTLAALIKNGLAAEFVDELKSRL